jgi:hypothetical protein
MSSYIRTTRVCETCKKEFEAKTTTTRFCSKPCNTKAYKDGIRRGKIETATHELEILKASKHVALNEKPFLTIKEACVLLCIGKTNLYEHIKNGKLLPILSPKLDELFKLIQSK